MAELDDDKSLDPTPHRRQQVREQGQTVRSQDVGSAILLLGTVGVLYGSANRSSTSWTPDDSPD